SPPDVVLNIVDCDASKGVRSLLAHLVVGIAAVAVVKESRAAPLGLFVAIPMPGVVGRIDHLALDVSDHRLYVAARSNDSLEVLDLSSRGTVAHVTGLSEPKGVVVVR